MLVKWAFSLFAFMLLMRIEGCCGQQGGSERLRDIEEGLAEFQEIVEDKE